MNRNELIATCPYCGKVVGIVENDPAYSEEINEIIAKWEAKGCVVFPLPRIPSELNKLIWCQCIKETKSGQLPLPGFSA